jgi:hypothetical protein
MNIYVLPAGLEDCSLRQFVDNDNKNIVGMVDPF